MNQYPVLQSGFVACGTLSVKRPDPFVSSNPRAPLFEQTDQDHTEAFYSPEVTKMYQEMITDPTYFNSFENREALIELAFKAFSDEFFGEWVDKQRKYAQIDQSHMDFLIDTAKFTCGLDRSLHLMTWLRMIIRGSRIENLSFDIIKGLSPEQEKDVLSQNALMTEMLSRWMARPDGCVDLMLTMQVIYGSRDPKAYLSTK